MDTTIKVDSAVRDRLAILSRERGMTIRELVTELASTSLTKAELAQRATRAAEYLKSRVAPDLTEADIAAGERFWRTLETGGSPASLDATADRGQAA